MDNNSVLVSACFNIFCPMLQSWRVAWRDSEVNPRPIRLSYLSLLTSLASCINFLTSDSFFPWPELLFTYPLTKLIVRNISHGKIFDA